MSKKNVTTVEEPSYNETLDKVLNLFKDQAADVQSLVEKKLSLQDNVRELKELAEFLEVEKNNLTEDINRSKLRNVTLQKEHVHFRNAITILRYQLQKLKESIAEVEANDLKALEEFEKSTDEITQKFRLAPFDYNRGLLLEKISKEKERKEFLTNELNKLKESFMKFSRENGLRIRENKSEELTECVLPGSELYNLVQSLRTLDLVISEMRNIPETGVLDVHHQIVENVLVAPEN